MDASCNPGPVSRPASRGFRPPPGVMRFDAGGRSVEIEADPRTSLRERLALRGVETGRDRRARAACTALVIGGRTVFRPALATRCDRAAVITREGLAGEADHGGGARKHDMTDQTNLLARAATTAKGAGQGSIAQGIEAAPDAWMPGGKPDPLAFRRHGHVGRPVSRIDGPLKVAGGARFAAEFSPPGMAYATVVFSTVAKGRIATLDTVEAEAAPGIVLVMTHRNAPRMRPMPRILSSTAGKPVGCDDLPVMQDDLVHWNGQPVAVVLGETQEEADHGAFLVRVAYEACEATTSLAGAEAKGRKPGDWRGEPLLLDIGDAEAALAQAPFSVDATYRTPFHNHAALEPHAATVAWDGDRLIVHDATQAVTHTAWSLATMFGIDEGQVHVTSPYVGGGFGSKLLWQHQVLGAAIAKLAGRPVRIALSREGVFRIVGGRSLTEQRVAIGARSDGRFVAVIHTGLSVKPSHSAIPEPFVLGTRHAYAAETFKIDLEVAHLDAVANTFMRAPGEAVGTFALECAIDELAISLGLDPIELRIRNEPEHDPTSGAPWSSRSLVEAYRRGAERFGWSERRAPGSRREGEWLVGLGCATGTYPFYRRSGGVARITLARDARVRIAVAGHEMGMGTATAHTQVAAERLGLDLDQVAIDYGDSTLPGLFVAGGSAQTAGIGAAVLAAYEALVGELLQLAGNDSPLAGLRPDQVHGAHGGLAMIDEPSRHESYASILSRARRDAITVEGKSPDPLELQHWSMHSWSAMFCEVRVNAVTGETRVTRCLGSFDCGRIVNAKTAASQFRGGIIMGLGMALMEETAFDERSGRIMNPSMAEYHVPVHLDVPPIEVLWTDIPDPHAPMGARGIGEIGITGTAAAVANAIHNATGRRVRDLPITLDKLI